MPDSIRSLFCCLCRFLLDAEPGARGSEAEETVVAIDHPQIPAAEAHDVAAGVAFGETDEFACKRFTDEHEVAAAATSGTSA